MCCLEVEIEMWKQKKEREEKILSDIVRMLDNEQYNLIFPNTLYDWVLQDYKPAERLEIIKGLVKKGYLRKTKKGNAYIVINR